MAQSDALTELISPGALKFGSRPGAGQSLDGGGGGRNKRPAPGQAPGNDGGEVSRGSASLPFQGKSKRAKAKAKKRAVPPPPPPGMRKKAKGGEAPRRERAAAVVARVDVEPEDPATAPPRAALVGAEAGTVRARTTASAPLARWGCPTIVNFVAPLRRARNTSPRTARRNRPMSIGDMGRLAHRRRALPFRGRIPRSRSVLPSSESWKSDWFMLRSS